ncbi:MAG: Nif3-like dinuclear metal center hexameric protein, partial [Leptospiraceae bacterium]|nr:Nif3-like dinuclear metal center hexameric protein [Leptospiraceae bacterium]
LENDNCGLQVGNANSKLRNILITLDVTENVVDEAIKKKAQLIISHHPLIFKPIRNIIEQDIIGRIILKLVRNDISLYTMHTNLDATRDGVNFAIAKALNLKNVQFLSQLRNLLVKIVVFVPENYSDKVMKAMASAGAGIIGGYSFCSFRAKGIGTFRGSKTTNPFLGQAEKLESVEEVRLEMIAESSLVPRVISEMKKAHPYEEVAYDVYNLAIPHSNYGMGAIGLLPKPQSLENFLLKVKKILGSKALKCNRVSKKLVQKIAVCGGAGSNMISDAINANADVFLTADVKYHTFQLIDDNIVIVDAGHWETEHLVLRWILKKIREYVRKKGENIGVSISKKSNNPVFVI